MRAGGRMKVVALSKCDRCRARSTPWTRRDQLRRLARVALAVTWLAMATGAARAETRVALVIGNGAYRSVPSLDNPPNDAKDVAAELRTLGFKVTAGVDLNQASMEHALAEFARAAASADVSLFYYGGHGLPVPAP